MDQLKQLWKDIPKAVRWTTLGVLALVLIGLAGGGGDNKTKATTSAVKATVQKRVPNVVGYSPQEAISALHKAGFSHTKSHGGLGSEENKGFAVCRTSPRAGTTAGDTIEIFSSKTCAAKTSRARAERAAQAPKRKSVREALDDAEPKGAGEVTVRKIDPTDETGTMFVYLKTPEGGMEGASADDLDNSASAAFKAVYGVAHSHAKTVDIVFQGGLVNSKTGEELTDQSTGVYTMTRRQAKRINWDDDDAVSYAIDWSNYRTFIHPAIKQ